MSIPNRSGLETGCTPGSHACGLATVEFIFVWPLANQKCSRCLATKCFHIKEINCLVKHEPLRQFDACVL